MTQNKSMFVQWYRNNHPSEHCRAVYGTPAVEVGDISKIDPHYPITQIADNRWLVFIGVTAKEALELHEQLKDGIFETHRGSYHKPFLPTTINAGLKWLSHNNIPVIEKHRLAFFDPNDLGIEGFPKRPYYYIEVSNEKIGDKELVNVPHRFNSETSTYTILLKAPGYVAAKNNPVYINDTYRLLREITKAVLEDSPYDNLIQKYFNLFYEREIVIQGDVSRATLIEHLPTLSTYLMTVKVM